MLKSFTLQDKAVVAAKQIFSSTSEKSVITSIPEKESAVGKSADGPRRILVQASDKPASRMVSTPIFPVPGEMVWSCSLSSSSPSFWSSLRPGSFGSPSGRDLRNYRCKNSFIPPFAFLRSCIKTSPPFIFIAYQYTYMLNAVYVLHI